MLYFSLTPKPSNLLIHARGSFAWIGAHMNRRNEIGSLIGSPFFINLIATIGEVVPIYFLWKLYVEFMLCHVPSNLTNPLGPQYTQTTN